MPSLGNQVSSRLLRAHVPGAPTWGDYREADDGLEDLYYTREDLTPDNKVPVIVSVPGHSRRMARLCERCLGVEDAEQLPLVNGFIAEIEPEKLKDLRDRLPAEARVAVNARIHFDKPLKVLPMIAPDDSEARGNYSPTLPGIQKVHEKGFTGKGQTIAVIDSGIHPHPDLKDRVVGWMDISNEKRPKMVDPYGHGTHVAGVAAGSGVKSAGKYQGIAPEANLVGVRITTVAEAIKALQWVIENKEKYGITVVNMSLGDFATKSYKDDPWAQATQKAIDAGLIVVVAAGNEGPQPSTISTPGTTPDAITVGAYDDKATPDDPKDDTVAGFSSRGPTAVDHLQKPDILAPGVRVFGPLSPGSKLDVPELPHQGKDYFAMSGTSQATPMAAGLAALLKQANPKLTHHDIKKILVASADHNLPDDGNSQGAGLINAEKALDLALKSA
ncbi:MAG: S8 family peptidase [Candidatus Eremiobacterota bacterium]